MTVHCSYAQAAWQLYYIYIMYKCIIFELVKRKVAWWLHGRYLMIVDC